MNILPQMTDDAYLGRARWLDFMGAVSDGTRSLCNVNGDSLTASLIDFTKESTRRRIWNLRRKPRPMLP